MSRLSPKPSLRIAVAFCAVWQSAGTGIATAQAGCGDYVHLGAMQPADHAIGATPGSSDSLIGLELLDPDHGLPRRPCHGPHCRQEPLTPAAPLPAPTTSGSHQKACLIDQGVPQLPVVYTVILAVETRHDEMSGSRIERPPRLCS
jgi:hypothetical protein